tara:strand:- start:29 stop:223 length:195 start_codon:yes stop_codon:yes gene_type:complete
MKVCKKDNPKERELLIIGCGTLKMPDLTVSVTYELVYRARTMHDISNGLRPVFIIELKALNKIN